MDFFRKDGEIIKLLRRGLLGRRRISFSGGRRWLSFRRFWLNWFWFHLFYDGFSWFWFHFYGFLQSGPFFFRFVFYIFFKSVSHLQESLFCISIFFSYRIRLVNYQ